MGYSEKAGQCVVDVWFPGFPYAQLTSSVHMYIYKLIIWEDTAGSDPEMGEVPMCVDDILDYIPAAPLRRTKLYCIFLSQDSEQRGEPSRTADLTRPLVHVSRSATTGSP